MLTMALSHYEFGISEPFSAGSVLTLAEAQALNQLRLENIRNIASKMMTKAKRGDDGLLTGAAEQEVRRVIKDLDEHYEFKLRSPPRVKSSTLEAEIARVAEEAVDAHARQVGAELSEAQRREAEEAYRQSPSVLAEAKRRLAERIRVNSETIENLIGGRRGVTIESFSGEYRFLSNFWPTPISWNGNLWNTVEHAYQASKTLDEEERKRIRDLPRPGEAKKAGRLLKIRADWEEVKLGVMEELLRLKFANRYLKEKLLATRPREIIEGNTWGDRFWGQCPIGQGENHLGKLLMKIRQEAEDDK